MLIIPFIPNKASLILTLEVKNYKDQKPISDLFYTLFAMVKESKVL